MLARAVVLEPEDAARAGRDAHVGLGPFLLARDVGPRLGREQVHLPVRGGLLQRLVRTVDLPEIGLFLLPRTEYSSARKDVNGVRQR